MSRWRSYAHIDRKHQDGKPYPSTGTCESSFVYIATSKNWALLFFPHLHPKLHFQRKTADGMNQSIVETFHIFGVLKRGMGGIYFPTQEAPDGIHGQRIQSIRDKIQIGQGGCVDGAGVNPCLYLVAP